MRKNFTLVEILAVMALMAILLFIALPSFEKLVKGGGVSIAARNLTGKLGVARGYAINNRQFVAVLMPDANLPNDYMFRSYKLCVVSSTYDTTPPAPPPYVFTFVRWLPSENWGFLPTGTAIKHINSVAHSGSADYTGTFSNPATYPFERVKNVKLSEIDPVLYPSVDNVRAIVFRPNGKLAGASGYRYVAVAEATYNGSTLLSTNLKDWIDITIDQFTGRVNYGIE
ncbi:MAG: hypothetical protein WC637_14195 [Victivallales bacterium]